MTHTRIDGVDLSSMELADWLDDIADQLYWQRKQDWTAEFKVELRDTIRTLEDFSDYCRRLDDRV